MTEPLIVVPLDGSELSEKAVPYAVTIARATDARLLFCTIWEEGERALIANLPDQAEDLFKQGTEHYESYLAGVANQVEGVEVATEVLLGAPAEAIQRVLEQRDPRLLVIATHGRSGLSRWHYGSVASKLAREAPAPTIVIGPQVLADGAQEGAIRRILVPLDGSSLAEAALRPALEMAEALDASLVLAQVVNWTAQTFAFGPADVDIVEIDKRLTEGAQAYLERVKEEQKTQRPIETVVLHGLPASALIDLIAAKEIDLVVMSSHTRSGLTRAVLGSVAERLLQGKAPVLLIRPEGVAAVAQEQHGRYCHNCGRASPYIKLLPDDLCLRCRQHLRACANCVYFDGMSCLLQRSEVHDSNPGLNCPYFQFRETVPQRKEEKASGRATHPG